MELLPAGYTEYMAERPRSHGLFGDEDSVDMDDAIQELNEYPGNIWTHIISLKWLDMRRTLENLYYGNIIPSEQQMTPGSELKRAVDRVTRYESQLMEQLEETEQKILTKLIRSQHEIDSITALENFVLGFRLEVRLMAECMDDNDGDIRNGGE